MNDALHDQARAARDAVRAGSLRGGALLDVLLKISFTERDAFVDALLAVPELPDDARELPRDAVPYLPCEVEAIVAAVREAPLRPHDVFVDLGSGLGRPAVLAHLLTGCSAIGVELQPHLVTHARRIASQLGLDAVSFIEGDATAVDVSSGTVFFIYASFNGPALARVLASLERIAAQRRIVLCAVDFEVTGQSWLTSRRSQTPQLVLYESR